jgi:hypothetical protein
MYWYFFDASDRFGAPTDRSERQTNPLPQPYIRRLMMGASAEGDMVRLELTLWKVRQGHGSRISMHEISFGVRDPKDESCLLYTNV